LNKKPTLQKNILLLLPDPEEAYYLQSLCTNIGEVYPTSSLDEAIGQIAAYNFSIMIVDSTHAHYDRLRGLFKPHTSIIVIGSWRTELKLITQSWPADRYIDFALFAETKADPEGFKRMVETSLRHSHLIQEVQNLRFSLEHSDVEVKEAFYQIQEIKSVVEKSVVQELEKRIAMEAKYKGFRREKQKIEAILKQLYQANDVTMLLDIVNDIKELVLAAGITMYVMDESETTGKYLKPLVWDDSILAHTEFTKHIVLLDLQDFAAVTAHDGHFISSKNPSDDRRLSSRYLQHLKTPLSSILCVPIKHGRDVIGVLEVYNKTVNDKLYAGGFTAEDKNVMEQIAEHIAIAVNKLNLIQYDALTGLLRPDPFFDKVLLKIKSQIKRHQEEDSFAMVMGDVDWFKHYNDRNGHEAGNRLLRELADILRSSTREGDILCRYGGEEFLFFLSCADCQHESMLFTNRIRRNIENHYFDYQEFQPRKNLTMSFGVTHFSRERFPDLSKITKHDLIQVINEADLALAEAKGKRRSGPFPEDVSGEDFPEKNKIIVYQPRIGEDQEFPESIAPPSELPSDLKRDLPPDKPSYLSPELPPDFPADLPKSIIEKYTPKPEDKRKFKRHPATTYLLYKNGADRKVVRTLNISLGGVKIVSDYEFERGHSFELSLILGEIVLECKGDVVYSQPATTRQGFFFSGVKFRDLSFNDWKIMEKYFDKLPEEAGNEISH